MKNNVDLTKFLVSTKLDNSTENGDDGDSSYLTTDKIYLKSFDDLVFTSNKHCRKKLTDFAILTGAHQIIENNVGYGSYWTRTTAIDDDSSVYAVLPSGEMDNLNKTRKDVGVVISLSIDAKFLTNKDCYTIETTQSEDGEDIHIMKMGEYPCTRVNDQEAKVLEDLFNGGQLKQEMTCTGKLFTINGKDDKFLTKQIPEFIVDGHKYVRMINARKQSKEYDYLYRYSDGTIVANQESVEWVKVEPISFEIENWTQVEQMLLQKDLSKLDGVIKLTSQNIILGGLPYHSSNMQKNSSLWQNSLPRCFLNSANSWELDGNMQKKSDTRWDFSKSGLLNQAFNLEHRPIKEFEVPQQENYIPKYAYCGCIGLETLKIHKSVYFIDPHAFDNSNLNVAYKLHDGQGELFLASKFPDDEEDFLDKIFYKEMKSTLKGFTDQMLIMCEGDLSKYSSIAHILAQNKTALPIDFLFKLEEKEKLDDFINSSQFKFIKSEPLLNIAVSDVYDQLSLEESVGYFKFINMLGCFSIKRIADKNGKDGDSYLAQKSISLMATILKNKIMDFSTIEKIARALPFSGTVSQSFIDFLSVQNTKEEILPNLQMLLKLDEKLPGLFAKAMTGFDRVKTFRSSLDENGKPIAVSWEESFKKFYQEEKYIGINNKNEDIANVFSGAGLSQNIFNQVSDLREKAQLQGVEEHIAGTSVREKTIKEEVESIKRESGEMLAESKQLLEKVFQKQFTYEMLSKYDPNNAIIGLYCSCCANINSEFYGGKIAKATIESPDIQNIVVRNANGDIIAKGALYMNRRFGYGVINDFEINSRYKAHEDVYGDYNVAPGSRDEHERDMIFQAFMRGINAFIKEYDKQHPEMPVNKIHVGLGANKLRKQCLRYAHPPRKLVVPAYYDFIDAMQEQVVLYDREHAKEDEYEDDIESE